MGNGRARPSFQFQPSGKSKAKYLIKRKAPAMPRGLFYNRANLLLAYATFTKIITSVNSTSDSINASPRISATMMPGRAAGLRPSESQAAPATFPWPSAASPAARAIAKPEVSATQLVPATAPAVPCANAGTAIPDAIIIMNDNIPNFRIVSPYEFAARRWLTPCSLADALTLEHLAAISCQFSALGRSEN